MAAELQPHYASGGGINEAQPHALTCTDGYGIRHSAVDGDRVADAPRHRRFHAIAEAWGNRGLALRDLMRFEEALASFDQVLRLEPRNAVAFNCRGNVLRDMKNYDGAIENYSRAIELRPDYAEAIVNRGYSRWTLKQYGAGIADVEKGLTLDPDYPYARGELFHARMYSADWQDFDAGKREFALESLHFASKSGLSPKLSVSLARSATAHGCSDAGNHA